MGDLVGVYKVNVDDNAELAQEHGVQSIPTRFLFIRMVLIQKP